ncbi:MAG: DMT family transporter [Salaquimonas sp.]
MRSSPPSIADYSLLALLAAIFGAAFMLITVAVEFFPPLTVVTIRQGLASVIFVIAMYVVGQRFPAFGKVWLYILGGAVLGNAFPFFLVAWGQEEVGAGLAAILTSSTPIMALIVGQLFSKDEKLTLPKLAGVTLGFAGIIILFGVDNLFSTDSGQLRKYALLAAAMSYALNAFILKSLAGLPRFATIASVMLVSFLVMLPFSLGFDKPWTLTPDTNAILAIIALGVLSTGLGNLLRFEIVGRQGALFLTQISYLIPAFGLFWAWLFLDEVPSAKTYLALLLILLGIAVARISSGKPLPIGGR